MYNIYCVKPYYVLVAPAGCTKKQPAATNLFQIEKLVRDTQPEGARLNITSEDLQHTDEKSKITLPTLFWYKV